MACFTYHLVALQLTYQFFPFLNDLSEQAASFDSGRERQKLHSFWTFGKAGAYRGTRSRT